MVKPGVFKHVTCRNNIYPKSNIQRLAVPDELVFWSVIAEYTPPFYTAPIVNGKPWADPELDCSTFQPRWNELDGTVNRKSHNGVYEIQNGFPQNPIGRTGLKGRGLLGRWGPNHAADPVVTRWKRDQVGNIAVNGDTNKFAYKIFLNRTLI